MRLSPRQISAALGLADMTQEQVAEAAGIARLSLNRIIKGEALPKDGTLDKIKAVLEARGIEFIDNDGVRMKPTGIDVYNGAANFDKFYEFLYDHLRAQGGDVCLSIYDETLPAKHRKNPEMHRKRMKELVDRGDVTFRVLATESDFISHGYVQYRRLPQQYYTPTGFYAFGDCLALLSFVNPLEPYIVVIQSGPLTQAYRQGFDIAWKNAEPPPNETAQ